MASAERRDIIVWEFFNEFGLWIPYEPHVSKYIETHKNSSGCLHLSNADPSLSSYSIDFQALEQIASVSGMIYPIRRELYPSSNPAANGFMWQWACDGPHKWQSYELATMEFIEKAHLNRKSHINLANTPAGLPYTIDFRTSPWTQIRNDSGFPRRVRRQKLKHKYPKEKSRSPSKGATGPTSIGATSAPSAPRTATVPTPSINEASCRTRSAVNDSSEPWLKFVAGVAAPPAEECCICYDDLSAPSSFQSSAQHDAHVLELNKCSHMFHAACLRAMYESGAKNGHLQCPTCKTMYGERTGIAPKTGTMNHSIMAQSLPGYDGCRTIEITYDFSPGIQGPEHPNPGRRFYAHGFPRTCFLPDNAKGRKVLQLLKIAWDRRLTFTVSQSVTTGQSDTVTWNEIHHKTEFSDVSGHGYPDPNYLDNVLKELADQGVTEDLLGSQGSQ